LKFGQHSKQNRKSNIKDECLEKQYAITKNDLQNIKAYLNGKTNNSHTEYVSTEKSHFPSSNFNNDDRMNRIKEKQNKEKNALSQKNDYDIISKRYDMYRTDRNFASCIGNDFSKSNKYTPSWFANSRDEMRESTNFNNVEPQNYDFNSVPKQSFHQHNQYVNPPTNYNGYLDYNTTLKNDPNSLDSIINELDNYQSKFSSRYPKEKPTDIDRAFELTCNNNKEQESHYKNMPLMNNSPFNRDINVDTFMRFGETPMRSGKSLGYPSAFEHSFNFVASDVQNPYDCQIDRGNSTRLSNKTIARNY